jgi:hypothetical protein
MRSAVGDAFPGPFAACLRRQNVPRWYSRAGVEWRDYLLTREPFISKSAHRCGVALLKHFATNLERLQAKGAQSWMVVCPSAKWPKE